MTHKAIGEVRVRPLSLEGFATDLNAAMARTGATVRGLADELGIDKSAVSRVRTGKQVTQSNFIALFNWLSALDRSPTVVEEEGASLLANLGIEWSFCPECGCEEIRYEEGRHKQCANCGQEWFSDLDYRDVTAKNLRRLFAPTSPSKPEQAPSPVPQAVAKYDDAQRRVFDKLAAEGGGTWATYMMLDIAAAFASPLSGGDTGKVEVTDGIRICPERDGPCPHGMSCPYTGDRWRCDIDASRAALRTLEGKRT